MPVAAPGLVLLDSVTQVGLAHAGQLVVTGSHGGASVVRYARAVRAWLYVFNDAGVGKDGAGIAALDLLAADGIAAVTVAHTSARIGEALDSWEHGVVSRLNAIAAGLGLQAGTPLREQLHCD
ncbi:MAG: hypothetical protein JSW31_15410 [Burkholderiales bacterium]|nr:MAG: hypothetical protein JSW31_15410 [Burkholderiales bacterium]